MWIIAPELDRDAFLRRYPEFAKVEEERISLFLKDAESQISQKIWKELYEQGIYALTAHLLFASGALTSSKTPGEPIQVATNETAGNLSISYSAPDIGFSGDHAGLALTQYGQTYLRLRKLTARYFLAIR